jgi:hypothetical protein
MDIIKEIKESWSWVGIEPKEIVGQNDFGNLIIKDAYNKYWRLCPEDIYCEIVAETKEQLDLLSKDQEFLEDWYMQTLVEQANEQLGPLPENKKYHLVIPGPLGDEYGISNINIAPLVELIRFSGDVGKQIKDLPDGAQIELKVVD